MGLGWKMPQTQPDPCMQASNQNNSSVHWVYAPPLPRHFALEYVGRNVHDCMPDATLVGNRNTGRKL